MRGAMYDGCSISEMYYCCTTTGGWLVDKTLLPFFASKGYLEVEKEC